MFEELRKRALLPKTARLLRKGTPASGRQSWDSPVHNNRDAATVALSSERYERRDFLTAYCKRRGIEETPSMKEKLGALLDQYEATQESRRPEDIATWLDAKRATSSSLGLGARLLRQGWPQRKSKA